MTVTAQRRRRGIFPAIIPGLVGIALLGLCAYVTVDQFRFIAASASATGEVVELLLDDEAYFPVVRFVDDTGETYEFRSSVGANPAAFDVEEQVTVLYDPRDPRSSSIGTFFTLWMGSLFLGFMGLMFTGAGVLTYWVDGKSSQRSP